MKTSNGAVQKADRQGKPECHASTPRMNDAKQEISNRLEAQAVVLDEGTNSETPPQVQNINLKKEEQCLKDKLRVMQQKLKRAALTSVSLNENKAMLYTGLPSVQVFTWLVSWICGCFKSLDGISKSDQLLLTPVKLRLDLTVPDLAYRFNISRNTVCNIIADAFPKMACKLKFLINWPSKEELM